MRSSTFYKAVSGLLAVLMVAGGVLAAIMVYHTQLEADHFRKEKDQLAADLANATLKLKGQQEFLDRLQNDPAFIDRLARMRLGYAKPDEIIFRFDADSTAIAPPIANDTAIQPLTAGTNTKQNSLPSKTTKPTTAAKPARQ